ncbi:MAG: flagellar FliJ family protein [Hyphomonadaceae bacterium]
MKAFRTLLKIAERDLETLRRALGEQLTRQALIEERILGFQQTIRSEQQAARRDYEAARAYGGFAMVAVANTRALEAEREIVLAEIERIRALITEAHVEVRKFERLIELEEARTKAAADKREAAELDEFATLRAARPNSR